MKKTKRIVAGILAVVMLSIAFTSVAFAADCDRLSGRRMLTGEILDAINEKIEFRKPKALSGGQHQRVANGRAIVRNHSESGSGGIKPTRVIIKNITPPEERATVPYIPWYQTGKALISDSLKIRQRVISVIAANSSPSIIKPASHTILQELEELASRLRLQLREKGLAVNNIVRKDRDITMVFQNYAQAGDNVGSLLR